MLLFHMVLTIPIYAARPSDTLVIKKLLEKAYAAIFHEDSVLIYSGEALRLSKKASLENFISLSNQKIGDYYLQKEDYGKATEYYLEALKIEKLRNNKLRIANLALSIAFVYFIMEEFCTSMNYYQQALNIYTSEKDSLNLAQVLRGIGKLHNEREFCEPRDSLQKRMIS